MIEEVIPHTQLLFRTQQGWENVESFLMSRTGPFEVYACQTCGEEYPTEGMSCVKRKDSRQCTGYVAPSIRAAGTHTELMFRVRLDDESHMHQQHLKCERLKAQSGVDQREAKAARKECEKAEEALATAGKEARRTQAGLERKGMESETLRNRNRLLEEHLGKLRTAVGDLKFNEIVGPA